ncbi:MAG: phosphate ABC transporter substrate-binding protein [Ruminococcaceae bacterium]|nr:phosphate ABC transporter substrate-binding protein [Oscillospiraceae bacterium]
MYARMMGVAAMMIVLGLLMGCIGRRDEIFVISREDGSGTRSAFTKLVGVQVENEVGGVIDRTLDTAEITNSTGVMLSSVAENRNAIGYVSLGALNDEVKALMIDGEAATAENVRDGRYPVRRAFQIVLRQDAPAVVHDFVAFILGDSGQAVVEEAGYTGGGTGGMFPVRRSSGEITVSGSSSVFPVMEKLAEAYMSQNRGVKIVLQTSDSTTGIQDAADGLCDLGMTSRDLIDEERDGLHAYTIALDGIAVIVHPENTLENLSRQQICDIYTGTITGWEQLRP